ncbi:hypothetical protein ANANG_G00103700 [Anguilla anguilla]|uniref:HTH La-type RNA-binding domain-containing protein n=1 Tax=Anguilla anguilla TaxID=7936 RepID=A0A9D3MIX1_ANGAN|nr:hypothetical protein ANANG_G00103700 [Anguilla anguilla]
MHTIINAFLRCLSFLLPPPWLQLGFCWWVGDECRKTAWPNPRARFKGTKPLTDQEVRTQNPSTSATSPVQSCVSLAASPVLPQGSPWGRIWEPWQAVERNFWIPFAIRQRWCQTRQVPNYPNPSFCKTSAGKSCAVAEKELGVIVCEEEGRNELGREAFVPGMSATMELPSSLESLTDSAGLTVTGMVMDRQVQEMGTQVTITVAIEAAEDEDPSEVLSPNHLDIHGGSCSEDDAGRHDKSSGAGTSGGELEEESWQPPDPDLTQKLVAQIEYYLSDENLEHDAFLLKHVRRNKMGFVSVKLLTSFKKVKHLTRDWRTTAYALRQSTLLELNEEGRKVRRRTLVPVFASESLPSRMLLLSELQHWPELGVAQRGGAGTLGRGRRAGTAAPAATGRGGAAGTPHGGSAQSFRGVWRHLVGAGAEAGKGPAVRPEEAERPLRPAGHRGVRHCGVRGGGGRHQGPRSHGGETEDGAGAQGLKVVLIGTKPPKKKVPKDRQREEGGLRKSRSLNSRVRELQYLGDDSACSSSETESNPTSPRLARKARSTNKLSPTTGGGAAYQQNNHLSPGVSPRSSPWSSPRASPCSQRKSPHGHKSPLASEGRLSPESGRRWADYSSDSSLTPSGSPWVQRRGRWPPRRAARWAAPCWAGRSRTPTGCPRAW